MNDYVRKNGLFTLMYDTDGKYDMVGICFRPANSECDAKVNVKRDMLKSVTLSNMKHTPFNLFHHAFKAVLNINLKPDMIINQDQDVVPKPVDIEFTMGMTKDEYHAFKTFDINELERLINKTLEVDVIGNESVSMVDITELSQHLVYCLSTGLCKVKKEFEDDVN